MALDGEGLGLPLSAMVRKVLNLGAEEPAAGNGTGGTGAAGPEEEEPVNPNSNPLWWAKDFEGSLPDRDWGTFLSD